MDDAQPTSTLGAIPVGSRLFACWANQSYPELGFMQDIANLALRHTR